MLRYADISGKRLHHILDLCCHMGMCPVECGEDSAADHAAVFIVGLGQHDDELSGAALGDHITLP